MHTCVCVSIAGDIVTCSRPSAKKCVRMCGERQPLPTVLLLHGTARVHNVDAVVVKLEPALAVRSNERVIVPAMHATAVHQHAVQGKACFQQCPLARG